MARPLTRLRLEVRATSVTLIVAVALCGAGSAPVSALAEAVECAGQPATIIGTDGPDVLTGTAGDDVIAGLRGWDRIDGRGGADVSAVTSARTVCGEVAAPIRCAAARGRTWCHRAPEMT